MAFTDELRNRLKELVGKGKPFPNKKRMADALEVDPSQLNRFLSGERGLTVDSLGRILDRLGARLAFPDDPDDATREVCFVVPERSQVGREAPPPDSEDYIAVPLAASPVAAGPGLIPEDKIDGWVLVWRHHEAVRFRSNMVAVQIGKNELSMIPTLHPGDIVLVDRNERDPVPAGKIMLVTEPGGDDAGAMVKRVSTHKTSEDIELIFYSDNSRDFPPMVYRLARDYDDDITRAIVGKVVWAWSDMTRK
ncbi:Peptidase S24-like [Paucidesulfovibrio gracilis DSM 16080]|uniref:Peptidase S24-like n=1 Tax=Paucidesulfovibrio gracilis DSM 16080 TaxID=1121449 RepID=A0A1T4X7Z6_9BACT|nr:S24 family peptidase [Paucidesulfovibrio gracilis]SKA85579.1 Peptidase S24-like [Paucidesulfovibrio gracilis DSM 16080]